MRAYAQRMVDATRIARRLGEGLPCPRLRTVVGAALVDLVKSDAGGAPKLVKAIAREVVAETHVPDPSHRPSWPVWRVCWLLVRLRLELASDPQADLFDVLRKESTWPDDPALPQIDCDSWEVAIALSGNSWPSYDDLLDAARLCTQDQPAPLDRLPAFGGAGAVRRSAGSAG